jgi:hypothetical protein
MNGWLPTLSGAMVMVDLHYAYRNIMAISTSTGWSAASHSIFALMEIIIAVILIYELGIIYTHANNWNKYNQLQKDNTIDSSSCDCETSDEAADTSSDTKSKGKRKKS